ISSEKISLQDKKYRYMVAIDITDLMETELELKKSEQQYRQHFENMSNAFALHEMIYDSEGRPCDYRYLEVNAAFGKQTGLNPQSLVGHTVMEILPNTEESWIKTYGEVAESGKTLTFENYSMELDRYFDVTVFSPNKGQFATLFTDITERRLREEKIQILLQAVAQSPVSIVITDKNGTIEYVNPKFSSLTGYSQEEAIGKNPRILQSGETARELYDDLWRSISSGKPWVGVLHNKKKSGELYWESVSISPIINADSLITHYVAVKEDITIRKTMEEELKAAKEKAEESERLKSAFLANMSHEIRTPMNGILGFADLLREPRLSEEEHDQYLSIIEKSGQRMLNIINDLVNISKVESGQMKLSMSETNINEQLLFLYNFFKLEAKQKGIELIFVYPLKDKDSNIITDREKVYAVLTNLIKNALKFTTEGSITIGYELDNDTLRFFVQDTGIGIPASHLTAVFDRFKQVDSELSSGIEGSGLGLSIAKAYIELLGGSIWVESEEGKGSTFYFTLPYLRDTSKSDEKPVYITKQGVSHKEYPQGISILIAEDDESSQKYLQAILSNMNFNLIFVRNGWEAVEACQNDPKINLVLMDIKMSVMDGYTAAKMIRQFRPQIPVIAQTAIAVDTEQYTDAFTEYLTKPVRASEIIAAIDKALNY
ncbi:MAG: PAS domain S-box protein, partial [Bacteroidales bacterium]|nr:PAS domain S-box protein [Bacteroidales bacterium]